MPQAKLLNDAESADGRMHHTSASMQSLLTHCVYLKKRGQIGVGSPKKLTWQS